MTAMLLVAVLLSGLFLSICLLYLVRVRELPADASKSMVICGSRLIMYAGCLLAALNMITTASGSPDFYQTCHALFVAKDFDGYTLNGCNIERPLWWDLTVMNLSFVMTALLWIVPLIFASVGVNVLSQGILLKSETDGITEDAIIRFLPTRIQNLVKRLFNQFPK